MRIFSFFLFAGVLFSSAANSYSQVFTLNLKSTSIKEVCKEIERQSDLIFVFSDKSESLMDKKVSIKADTENITEILDIVLSNTKLSYKVLGKQIVIYESQKNAATAKDENIRAENDSRQQPQKKQITGTITDEKGEAIIGANIVEKSTKKGTSTDIHGHFSLQVDTDDAVLSVSYIGYLTQEIETHGHSKLHIIMHEDTQVFEDVVITGYQKLGVNQAAGSYNTINMSDFEKKISPNITSTLEGLSPSLVVSSEPGGRKILTIRGVSTLQGNQSPLIIVDGFPYGDDLSTINPYEIENITLLKDAASASIYGAKSANGVIVITTKRGKKSNLEVRYSSTTQIAQKPDIDYLMNRVSSSDMVDIEKNYFERYERDYATTGGMQSYQSMLENGNPSAGRHVNPYNKTLQLLLAHKEKRITQKEMEEQIALLRRTDNRNDLDRLLLQTPVFTEHSLAASYGGEQFRLRTSLNYYSDKSGFKGTMNDGVRYNLNSVFDISDKFRLDLLANFNIGKNESYKDSPSSFLYLSPYERFYDDAGNPLPVTKPGGDNGTDSGGKTGGKDSYEIERLKKLGLLDETYYPASDYGLSRRMSENWGTRFQAQMRLKITSGLDGVLAFDINKRAMTDKTITDGNSWEMKNMINNLTRKTEDGKKGNLIIPIGSRILETRGESTNYLLRGQLDFDKTFDKHQIIALIGSEIQANKQISTTVDRLGYDESSNLFRDVDYYTLSTTTLNNLFIPLGYVAGGVRFGNSFAETENRYFSLYANTNYSYDSKYVLSGSIRIDQSNLFGTDPRYRFRPFWSVGGKWRMAEEGFFSQNIFSKFDWQVSYGINGNISNESGPFDIADHSYAGRSNMARSLTISAYAVPDLRWEQTGTFNIGLHTQMLNDRLSFSFDYYRKHTKDVLAMAEWNPTLGYPSILRNDATILNDGYEFSFSSANVKTKYFEWNTYLNLNFNKSKVEKIYEVTEKAAYWIAGTVQNRLGYEPRSLFVFDWAGVDEKGNGLVRRANGDLTAISPTVYEKGVFSPSDLMRADFKHAGTTLPKTVMGFTNNFVYKNFSLSLMFVYQGGHVLIRDGYNGEFISSNPGSVNIEAAKAWQKSGDETKTTVPRWSSATYSSIAEASTKNVIPGDFIRLRDAIFSYTFPHGTLESLGIKEFTLNLTGKNLWLWTKNRYGIDPETQGLGSRNFPVAKSFTAGFNITF